MAAACLRNRLAAALGLLGLLYAPGVATAQVPQQTAPEPLTVQLTSGRNLRVQVDFRSNEEQLVLRSSRAGATLRRSIPWSEVAGAIVGDRPVETARLKATLLAMRSEGAPLAAGAAIAAESSADPLSPAVVVSPPRVTAVTFDARLANWDGDVETDGIVVDVFPLDQVGSMIPARGTVEVELFAPQKRVFHHAPLSGGDTLERVERWTRTIEPEDLTASGARLRLPFGAVHPEFDWDWIGVGLVHVQLVVPGDGVFEDSLDGLRIKPYAPLRDRLEMNTGQRFVPTERLGRHN